MPLYDFRCRNCMHEFEALVRHEQSQACPSCESPDLDRLLSTFAVSSADRTRAAVSTARKTAAVEGRSKNMAIERESDAHRREDH